MLFLLNDVVFDLANNGPPPVRKFARFCPNDLDQVLELGCQLFAADPHLHRNNPEQARRLAWLIQQNGEGVNAALFAAHEAGCDPELVEPRFCILPEPVMHLLHNRSIQGQLDTTHTDEVVWGRIAA